MFYSQLLLQKKVRLGGRGPSLRCCARQACGVPQFKPRPFLAPPLHLQDNVERLLQRPMRPVPFLPAVRASRRRRIWGACGSPPTGTGP